MRHVSHARVSAGRVVNDAACVQLGHADLGQVGADGIVATAPTILIATKSISSTTWHAWVDPADGQKEQEQGMQRFVCMMACSV